VMVARSAPKSWEAALAVIRAPEWHGVVPVALTAAQQAQVHALQRHGSFSFDSSAQHAPVAFLGRVVECAGIALRALPDVQQERLGADGERLLLGSATMSAARAAVSSMRECGDATLSALDKGALIGSEWARDLADGTAGAVLVRSQLTAPPEPAPADVLRAVTVAPLRVPRVFP
jgi:hypothetical protein